MSEFPQTDLNKVKRLPKRGQYDKKTIYHHGAVANRMLTYSQC